MYIEDISNFLDVISNIRYDFDNAIADIQERDDMTSDIQHYLELCSTDAIARVKLANRMVEIRKARRAAKDKLAMCEKVLEWYNNNQAAVKKLQSTLGELRKVERNQANRAYYVRTDILQDFTENTHLREKNDRSGDDSVG